MKKVQSSRSIIAASQRLPRNSHQVPVMKSPVVTMTPASQRLLSETIQVKPEQAERGSVQLRRATASFQIGHLTIQAGEAFYFVASKFARRFYVIAVRGGNFVCSASDRMVAGQCIDQVAKFAAAAAA